MYIFNKNTLQLFRVVKIFIWLNETAHFTFKLLARVVLFVRAFESHNQLSFCFICNPLLVFSLTLLHIFFLKLNDKKLNHIFLSIAF